VSGPSGPDFLCMAVTSFIYSSMRPPGAILFDGQDIGAIPGSDAVRARCATWGCIELLDVSVQAIALNLLQELKKERGISYLARRSVRRGLQEPGSRAMAGAMPRAFCKPGS
jgi:hypothetical protein